MFKLISKLLVPFLSFTLVIGAVYGITDYRFSVLANDPNTIKFVSAKERDRQLTCLARNIYFESASEPFEGKVAVAQVVINRAGSGDFPSDICNVVYQKNIVYQKTVCQFSWYCNHPSTLKIRSEDLYDESMEVAKKVLLEGFRLPGLKEAMYYHADYVNPKWNKVFLGQIGRHKFYSQEKKHA
jgi:spore germination cell wall hydrolase CwlJ-like protein